MFRSTRLRTTLLATAAVATLTACDDDDPGAPVEYGRVRVIHAIGNAPAVRVDVDGELLGGYSSLAFKNESPYGNLRGGSYDFTVTPAGAETPLLTLNDQAIDRTTGQSLILLGRAGATGALAPAIRFLADAPIPATGQSSLRVLNASPSGGNVDVYVTGRTADLATEQPDAANVTFNAAELTNITFPAGTYRVRITPAGSKTVRVDRDSVVFSSRQRVLGVAVGDNAPGTGSASTYDLLLRGEN